MAKLSPTLQAQYDVNSQRWLPVVFPNFFVYNGPAVNWIANPVKFAIVSTLIAIPILYGLYVLIYGNKTLPSKPIMAGVILLVFAIKWLYQYRYNNTFLDVAPNSSDNITYAEVMGGAMYGRHRLI